MAKKIRITLIVLGLILFLVVAIPNTELFKGAFDPFGKKKIPVPRLPNPPRQEATRLPNFKDLLKKSGESKKIIPFEKKKLRSFFDKEVEKKIREFEEKLAGVSMTDKDQLLHLFNHEQVNDKLTYVRKMAVLPSLLTSWSKFISQIELLPTSKPVRDMLDAMKASIPKIRALYDEEQYKEVTERINEIRLSSIPILQDAIRLQTKNASQPELLNALTALKWFLLFELPYPLAEERSVPIQPPSIQAGTPLNVLVCVMRWNSNDPEISIDTLRPVMERVNDYYREVSYNKVTIHTQFAGNTVWAGPIPLDTNTETAAAIEICDASVDFRRIDALVIYPSVAIQGGGLSSFGQERHITEDGAVSMSIAYIRSDPTNHNEMASTIAHELGHGAFGGSLGHANGMECGDETLQVTGGCTPQEYEDPFDLMGNSFFYGHISGWRKRMLNWINEITVTQNGTYVIEALEMPSTGPQMLRIPYTQYPLCIDYRKPFGQDFFVNKNSIPPYEDLQDMANRMQPPPKGCLHVSICSNARNESGRTYLLDPSPNIHVNLLERASFDFADACIHQDTVFNIEQLDTSLSFHENSDGHADIAIHIDDQRIAQFPDLGIRMRGINDCDLTGRFESLVVNDGEIPVTNTFHVQIIGISSVGTETVVLEEEISGLPLGKYWTPEALPDFSTYEALRVVLDPYNRIAESDETNNSAEEWRGCFEF